MKKLLVLSVIIAFIAVSFSFIEDDPGYKNLKVLPKNTTHDQMDSIMKHFAKSLGVKCNFCHERSDDGKHFDFAKDGNEHKETARSMMRMTNKINKKYFKYGTPVNPVMTCFSCHHGNKEPVKTPPFDKDDE